MKFNLPRTTITKEIAKVISREAKKQKIYILRSSKKILTSLVKICFEIEKEGIPKRFVLKKLPKKFGSGIFLHPDAEPILKGEVIGPYAGEISFVPQFMPDDSAYAFAPISDLRFAKEEQKLFDPKLRYHPKRLYQLNVDAVKQGNFTRFVNHSSRPNVRAEFFKIPRNKYGLDPSPLEIIYIAKKTIHPGEQLLISYEGDGPSYWGALGIKPIPVTPKTFRLDKSLKIIQERRRARG